MHQADDQWQCWPYIQSKYGGSYLDTFGRLQKFLTVIVKCSSVNGSVVNRISTRNPAIVDKLRDEFRYQSTDL